MTRKNLFFCLPILFALVQLGGAQIVVTTPSEFLGEDPTLEPIEGISNSFFWRAPDAERKYRAVLVEQPETFLDADSEYKGIKPDAFKAIADTLRDFIATKVAERHALVELVDQPGPDVVRLRVALMDVYLKKGRRASWAHNVGPAVYSMRAAIGRNISLIEARIEAEGVDAENGKRLAVFVAQAGQRKVKELDVSATPSSWSDLLWRLDQLSEVAAPRVADLFIDASGDLGGTLKEPKD